MLHVLDITSRLLVEAARGARCATNTAPQAQGQLPPPNNMGVTVTPAGAAAPAASGVDAVWMGVHWFSGTTRRTIEDVCEVVSGLRAGALVEEHKHGARGGYARSAKCGGVLVAWSDTRPDVLVTVPGAICEELGTSGLVALSLRAELEPSSRLNVAWDAEGLTPDMLGDAFRAGDVVTRIQRPIDPETGRMHGIERRENHEGDTVYLGSRSSERFVRAYNRRGPCRVELELKERRAVELWRRLLALQDEDAWSGEALAELRAFLDFRKREEGVNPQRCELLPWWAEFCQGAERRSTVLPRKVDKLETMDRWLRRQVAPVLALVVDAYGDEVLRDLMTLGRGRYMLRPDRLALLGEVQGWSEAAD